MAKRNKQKTFDEELRSIASRILSPEQMNVMTLLYPPQGSGEKPKARKWVAAYLDMDLKKVHRLVREARRALAESYPSTANRQHLLFLIEGYKSDIERLQSNLERDLNHRP